MMASICDRLDTYSILNTVKRNTPSWSHRRRTRPWQTIVSSSNIWSRLDRIAVLGEDDANQGHSGCVNALHWSSDGSVLVSAGDDTRIHVWRLDPSNAPGDYPLTCTAKIYTGHTNNIFNAHILPQSSRIATCAADRQVRVFDVNRGGLSNHSGNLTEYQEQQACLRVLKCHHGRVKRIVTENSPDYFLTVSEDGSVRQHDLRTPHKCSLRNGTCPSPLLQLRLELSTIALSPLTPYNFVVAGDSPYAYLFDRRQSGRHLKAEWGVEYGTDDLTSCVRRFGRRKKNRNRLSGHGHVTGSRMSHDNGYELLLSYSADGVYLYSTRDPAEPQSASPPSVILSNKRRQLHSSSSGSDASGESTDDLDMDIMQSNESYQPVDTFHDVPSEEGTSTDDEAEEDELLADVPEDLRLPVVYPRRRYAGARNVETVKDVNFVGLRDEYVVSGSDDGEPFDEALRSILNMLTGNFFIWDKVSGTLLDILEGDGSIVNVIEQHPSLPVLAVSGIDDTVKIFAPSAESRQSSRMSQHEDIVNNNTRHTSLLTSPRFRLAELFLRYRRMGMEELSEDAQCTYQ